MKRAKRLRPSISVSMELPRPGLTPRQVNILKNAFKNLLVATLALTEREGLQPLIKQKKAIKQQKAIKQKPLIKMKKSAKRRGTRRVGKVARTAKTS